MKAIKTVDLTKEYKDTVAVDKFNIEIEEGELFSLLGVNGAGKTTVIKMLSCLIKPTKGKAFIKEYSILEDENEVKKIIGVSPQETAVAPGLSVGENLSLICRIHGFSKEKQKKKIMELMQNTPTITLAQIAQVFNLSRRQILRHVKILTNKGLIKREGSNRNGYWLLIK